MPTVLTKILSDAQPKTTQDRSGTAQGHSAFEVIADLLNMSKC